MWAERAHDPAWVLLPLRLFLGVTFVFAGLQKLANPSFFSSSSASGIQQQLLAATRNSPVPWLISPLQHQPIATGLAIALGELAVGIGTLLGILARPAAVGGLVISVGFLLAVSWHSHPYYLGPDIVFAFAWTPLVIAGAAGLGVDELLRDRASRSMDDARSVRGRPIKAGTPAFATELDRRTFLASMRAAAIAAGATAMLAVDATAIGRHFHNDSQPQAAGIGSPSLQARAGRAARQTQSQAPGSAGSTTSTTAAPGTQPAGTRIGPGTAVPVGGAARFTDPYSGRPAFVVQPTAGEFVALSAVCTHAGCPVQYTSVTKEFVCPCHGARFDAATGTPTRGPAQEPLRRIPLASSPDGQLYVSG